MRTITFKALDESGTDFSITMDERGIVTKADGIDIETAKFHMRRGKGIDGLVRAKSYTHAPVEGDGKAEEQPPTEKVDGTILKYDDDRRLAFGWAYTSHDANGEVVVDKSGEFISDVRTLEEAAYGFVTKSVRRSGVMHERDSKNLPVGTGDLVESMVFTKEKMEKMGIPPGILPQGAWWVGFRVDEDKWPDVKSGVYGSFSIAGKALKKAV